MKHSPIRNAAMIITAVLLCGCAHQQSQAPLAPAVLAPAVPPQPLAQPFTWAPPCMPPAKTGEEILMVQSAAEPLLAKLRSAPGYGGAWYSPAPCYRLIVAFTDGLPRKWVVDATDPRLRPYLFFSKTQFTEAERNRARLEIGAAIKAAGVTQAVFIDSGPNPERLGIGVLTEADAARVRLAIPERYRPLTNVWVGNIYPTLERGRGR